MQGEDSSQFIGAYWRHRAETAGAAAKKVAAFLQQAQVVQPLLRALMVVTGAQERLLLSGEPPADAAAIMLAMRHRDALYRDRSGVRVDFGEAALYPTGFGVGVYQLPEVYARGHAMDFSMTLGSDHAAVSNAVVLHLPAGADVGEPWVSEMLQLMVQFWTPDFAVLTSDALREAVEDAETSDHIGWINYFSDFTGAPPLEVHSIERAGKGAYVRLTERAGMEGKDVIRRAIAARKKLTAGGVLKRCL
jgi:Immunity protein 52